MIRKTIKKANSKMGDILAIKSHQTLSCKKCGKSVRCDSACVSVTCSQCICKMVAPPEIKEKVVVESSHPAGWKFMREFVDKDGTVYHFGVEQKKLKGTLPPSNVEKIRDEQKAKKKIMKEKKAVREQKKLDRENEKRKKEREQQKKIKEKKLKELKS